MSNEFTPGAEIEVAHPFIREVYNGFEEDGPFSTLSWRPGTRVDPHGPEDVEDVADGIGAQIIKVVSVHKPGRYPTRVFFSRTWRDPEGREFGKTKLCMATSSAFRRRCNGYRYEYRVAPPAEPATPTTSQPVTDGVDQ
jgi:hypothetical protein